MKIALAQLNYHVGNIELNAQKIIYTIRQAEVDNADLVVFSELAICGYSPLDMLENRAFVEKCLSAVKEIAKYTSNLAVIIGLPTINSAKKGKNLYNSAAFLYQGEIKQVFHKTLLPTYDVFDEYRYFEPNDEFKILEFKGKKIAITICEDLWDEQRTYGIFDKEMLYKNSPLELVSKYNPDFIINISGSPYSYNQDDNRKEILFKNAIRYSKPLIYVNQVGANTELIFDGASTVINRAGNTVLKCEHFEEDYRIIDMDTIDELPPLRFVQSANTKYENINKALVLGVRDYFQKSGLRKSVIGLSGGIDSALTVAIAVQALGNENVEVILMPTKYSSNHSVDDSIQMAKACNIKYHIVNIEELRLNYDKCLLDIFANTNQGITEENIQARIRGNVLMAFSNKFGHIVLNTSNKSEAAVGYTTLYGDMNGALSVLGDVYKTDVYKLANYINKNIAEIIPINIINKEPSAELKPNQKDSDSLPDYESLDKILYAYIEQKLCKEAIIKLGNEKEITEKVIKMVNYSEFKRFQAPPILRISSKSFGIGRRMPLVAKYL